MVPLCRRSLSALRSVMVNTLRGSLSNWRAPREQALDDKDKKPRLMWDGKSMSVCLTASGAGGGIGHLPGGGRAT